MKYFILSVCFVLMSVYASLAFNLNARALPISLRDNAGNFFYLSEYAGADKKQNCKVINIKVIRMQNLRLTTSP